MSERRRDPLATAVGLLTFLGGIGLIVATFALAQGMFSQPPEQALGIKTGETLDVNRVMAAGVGILAKIVVLIVMAGLGSAVASRGIKLYVQVGDRPGTDEKKPD